MPNVSKMSQEKKTKEAETLVDQGSVHLIRIPPSPQEYRRGSGVQSVDTEKCVKSEPDVSVTVFRDATPKTMAKIIRKALSFNADGNAEKRWYVYYYRVNPQTSRKERVRISDGINYEKDPDRKRELLAQLEVRVQQMLNLGIDDPVQLQNPGVGYTHSIGELITRIIAEKKAWQKKNSAKSTSVHLTVFFNFLARKGMTGFAPQLIKQSVIIEFRNYILERGCSNRTANNYIVDVAAFFAHLIARFEDYNYKNPCTGLMKLPSKSEKNVAYTQTQAIEISNILKENNPFLYLFCKFITYSFMRPDEIRNIQINQFDFTNWTITRTAKDHKTGKRKVQIIQKIFQKSIEELKLYNYPRDYYIFGIGMKPNVKPMSYGYFRKHFRKVKDKIGASEHHTMYGLKHTFISQLWRNGATDEELLSVTGLETTEALHKYLRDIGAVETKDLSAYYSYEF